MSAVPYLTGGETPSISYMNALFAALDGKLTTLLSGKSFFLAQAGQMPQKFCGKTFFFTSGIALYSRRVPGYIETGSGGTNFVARPYHHSQFTAAIPALTPSDGNALAGATVVARGNGYAVGDILTVTGGTGTAATLRVTGLTNGDQIGTVVVQTVGNYTANPTSPNRVTGGTGTGATFNLTIASDVWDEVNKIVKFPAAFASDVYDGLPVEFGVNFLDWSLEAHSILHQGSNDSEPVPYYIQEPGGATPPEKKYKFAVVEIILEGETAVTLPATYDKYSCFRVHNLNRISATVNFADAFTLSLGPFECKTVRRDSPTENYRLGYNYFFRFESGDPRFYWFLPKTFSHSQPVIGDGNAASNSMQANNMANPAMALDWVNYLTREMNWDSDTVGGAATPAQSNGWYAGWIQNVAEQSDISAFYADQFGDPSDGATLLGDLIHHKGDILIIRSSKTETDPVTGSPILSFDTVTFNGYASIVADFAAHQLTVAEDANQNYTITSVDSDNNVYLMPVSTNLLKSGDTHPTIVSLVDSAAFTVESAVFENPDYTSLTATPPQKIFQPVLSSLDYWACWDFEISNAGTGYKVNDLLTPDGGVIGGPTPEQTTFKVLSILVDGVASTDTSANGPIVSLQITKAGSYDTTPIANAGVPNAAQGGTGTGATFSQLSYARQVNQRTWTDFYTGESHILSGDQLFVLDWSAARDTSKTVHGIHRVTVADLLSLDWWGDPAVAGQNSSYVTLTNQQLKLTPEGLLVCYTETDAASPPAKASGGDVGALHDWYLMKHGVAIDKTIALRGHGWGYFSAANGSRDTGFVSGRKGRFQVSTAYQYEVTGPSGSDFVLNLFSATETEVAILSRVSNLKLAENASRFWTSSNPGDFVSKVWNNKSTLTPTEFGALFDSSIGDVGAINTGFSPLVTGALDAVAMALLPEMYNALARAVNAVTQGTPLMWQTLRFELDGSYLSLDRHDMEGIDPITGLPGGTFPGAGTIEFSVDIPVPMSFFAAFTPGSQFESFCNAYGIPVLSESDFPGGSGLTFAQIKAKKNLPAVVYDTLTLTAIGDSATNIQYFSGDTPDNNTFYSLDLNITHGGSITSELLSTAALQNGQTTGTHCVGTYDPTLYNYTFSGDKNYPDFTGKSAGDFYVANDGSGKVALYDPNGAGIGGVSQSNAFTDVTPGIAASPIGNIDLTQFSEFRWMSIDGLKAFIESMGFAFAYLESCQPLDLFYFEDVLSQSVIFSKDISAHNSYTDLKAFTGVIYSSINVDSYPTGISESFGISAITTLPGTLVKFAQSTSASAAWKYIGPITTGNVNPQPGGIVLNRISRTIASPLTRFTEIHAATPTDLSLVQEDNGNFKLNIVPAFEQNPFPSKFSADKKPFEALGTDGYLCVEYSATALAALIQLTDSEGSLMDQAQIGGIQNIYSASASFAPREILFAGMDVWTREADFWIQDADNFYAQSAGFSGAWTYSSAQSNKTISIGAGLNILSAGANEKYQLLFNIAAPTIDL